MTRLHDRLARLETGASEQDELETITWGNGETLTLPRHVITAIVRKASAGRSSLPVCSHSSSIWHENERQEKADHQLNA